MSMPDKKFPIIWTAFIIIILVAFAAIETWAILTGGTTLSRYVYELSRDWPILPWVIGVICGGLAVHFWWQWNPPGSSSEG